MMLVAIIYLVCLVIFLEFVVRAPEMDDEGRIIGDDQ
jgi:hypothetical protein